jgi:hypothetical protein
MLRNELIDLAFRGGMDGIGHGRRRGTERLGSGPSCGRLAVGSSQAELRAWQTRLVGVRPAQPCRRAPEEVTCEPLSGKVARGGRLFDAARGHPVRRALAFHGTCSVVAESWPG